MWYWNSYASGGWVVSSDAAVGSSNSVLPPMLEGRLTALALDHKDNFEYVGLTQGTKNELLLLISNPDFWRGDNADQVSLEAQVERGFEVQVAATPSPTGAPSRSPTFSCRDCSGHQQRDLLFARLPCCPASYSNAESSSKEENRRLYLAAIRADSISLTPPGSRGNVGNTNIYHNLPAADITSVAQKGEIIATAAAHTPLRSAILAGALFVGALFVVAAFGVIAVFFFYNRPSKRGQITKHNGGRYFSMPICV
jgi:hypothetical protein